MAVYDDMAKQHSYVITTKNNQTENEAIEYLASKDSRFIVPSREGRKGIMGLFHLDKGFARAFDLVIIEGHSGNEEEIELTNPKKITLVELKTTKKKLPHFPRGFFFGATKNEFDLAKKLGGRYKFCFVSLHPESAAYTLLSLSEIESLIKTKRIQYQINL